MLTVNEINVTAGITLQDYVQKRQPVKITGLLMSWPAYSALTLAELCKNGRDATIAVQHGNIEQGRTLISRLPFFEYLQILSQSAFKVGQSQGYLAQVQSDEIIDSIHQLFPLRTIIPKARFFYPYLWMGPPGTVTGLHRDDSNNVLGQIEGSKSIVLIPPSDSRYVYKSRKYDPGADLSCVDAEAPDYKRYPLFSKVTAHSTTLNRGEMLYIPAGWWHQVRSLTVSVSVSCFFQNLLEYLITVPASVLEWLHNLGIYRTAAGCICHSAESRRLRNN